MTNWCQSASQVLCFWAQSRRSRPWSAVKRSCIKTPLHTVHGQQASTKDKDNISTPLAIDQRAVICLEEAVKLFIATRNKCRSSWGDPSVVHCHFFFLLGSRRSTTSKLTALWNCSTAHNLLLREGKSSFSKAYNPHPFKRRKLLVFLLFPSWRYT